MQATTSLSKRPWVDTTTQLKEANEKIASLEAQRDFMAPVESLIPHPWRIGGKVPQKSIIRLASSIIQVGMLNPVIVRKHPTNVDSYEILKGESRWRAHKMLGQKLIRIHLLEVSNEKMAAVLHGLRLEVPVSDYEHARGFIGLNSEPGKLARACRACGLPDGALDHLLPFGNLPSFVIDQLDRTPRLLSASVAGQISRQLQFNEQAAMSAIRQHWKDLIDGITDDIEFGARVSSSAGVYTNDQHEDPDLGSDCWPRSTS